MLNTPFSNKLVLHLIQAHEHQVGMRAVKQVGAGESVS